MLVIFDCDGVLIDSEAIACRVDAEALGALGFAITAEEVAARFCGSTLEAMLAALEAEQAIAIPDDFGDRLRARVREAFAAELQPMTGIEAALEQIAAPRCVASSSDPERLAASLRLTGLYRRFAPHIFSASLVPRGKPAPDLFLYAAREMGVAPAETLVVEDSLAGVAAGRAAGMTVIGFAGGGHCLPGHRRGLMAAGAVAVLTEMSELPQVLAALGRQLGSL